MGSLGSAQLHVGLERGTGPFAVLSTPPAEWLTTATVHAVNRLQ